MLVAHCKMYDFRGVQKGVWRVSGTSEDKENVSVPTQAAVMTSVKLGLTGRL